MLYVDDVVRTGVDLFEVACQNDLEGLVAKPLVRASGAL
jgi:ATP-dependent DNA ligase